LHAVLRWPLALHTGPLRCFVGLLCATTGALMLVAPHQFGTPVYASIRPHLVLWGIGFVTAGVGLLGLIGFSPGRAVRITVHLFGGGALLILGLGFAAEGGIVRAVFYGVLGLATAFAAFVPFANRRPTQRSRDLHIITVGAATALIGVSMLAVPGQFGTSFDAIRSLLPAYGLAFFASGSLLLYTQFSVPSHAATFWVADLAAAATLLAFMLQTAIPVTDWMAVVLYGASAIGLLGIPWLAPRLEQRDGTSHRVRIALALCAAATLPLVTAVALYAPREEAVVADQVMALHQATAEGLALAWSRDVSANAGSAISIAQLIAAADPGSQGRISVLDTNGRLIASHPDAPPDAAPTGFPPQLPGDVASGSLAYESNGQAWLAGYAAVGAMGGRFVVEQPAMAALADVHAANEMTFGLLVLAGGLAAIAGSWVAGLLAAPLRVLAVAVEGFGAGESTTPIPLSQIAEVALLARNFGTMREQLAEHAVERERAHQELRVLNAGLEQRVLDRTGELQLAVKELEAFSYSVSHDLRAPLRQIDGFSLALLEDYGQHLDKEGQADLHWIRDGTQRMARLIDDLLKLSRITRTRLRSEPVDLSALAAEVTVGLRRANPQQPITSSLEPGLTADGDRGLLLIVLENLLGNAWKFTRNEPLAEVAFGAVPSEGPLAYFVRDNGAGFDMAYSDRLFGAFQRLHSEQEFEGTGIGLATVQRAVARHGGRVWAEGAVGMGATIWFTLVAAAQLDRAGEPHAQEEDR
jgi:signal transduction histidine kinase